MSRAARTKAVQAGFGLGRWSPLRNQKADSATLLGPLAPDATNR